MPLFNPAVGKYKLIPNSLLTQKTNRIFGFAYDFVTEDYKVICVPYLINDDYLINPYLINDDYVDVVEVILRVTTSEAAIYFFSDYLMATENNFVQAAIPRFDGHYDHWSMLMENFLRSKEYWPIIQDGIGTPMEGEVLTNAQKAELEAKKLKDLKAKNYLFQAIDRPILETILCKETSKDIWDSMKKKYQGSSRVKRAQLQALRKDFETLEMKEGESVTNYCARTMQITNKMRFHGEKINDIAIVEKILRSLTSKYNYVVCPIEESKDINELSHDELQSSLLVHEQKMNRSSGAQEHALKASTNTYSSNYRGRDTGCNNHMCGSKFSFSSLDEKFRSTVAFGDCSTVEVMGKGDIKIKTKNGFVETISNVLYVPNLKSNLLSAGQLQEKGYVITIKKGECENYDPERGAIALVQMSSNRLFPLRIDSIQSCLMAEVKDSSWMWHFRYGHLSFGGLKILQQKNMVSGKSWRAKDVLELVHSDLCGPINPTSNGGKRYLITFTDDFSRKTWVYFMEEKSEVFSTFKSFKVRVENEAGKTIKAFRTDRGGEYCSKEFEVLCTDHGIRRELTAAYTPQQNGVS
ncbi:uncharacterized protein LOC125834501 [Solanum verrucosum]|uniref:uncharacterized protein LOC125834501 n=1 Tax=Solanum verrucosum TaxID=315347 RepID=UPI0020D07560|nr:uncharacterized protein LOC125834501 [Solanum verrucosum]